MARSGRMVRTSFYYCGPLHVEKKYSEGVMHRRSAVPVNGVWRESRQAHGNILRPFGRTVSDPLSPTGNHGLTGLHVQGAAFMLYPEQALQNQGELIELRPLSRLHPSRWAPHMGDAGPVRLRVHS